MRTLCFECVPFDVETNPTPLDTTSHERYTCRIMVKRNANSSSMSQLVSWHLSIKQIERSFFFALFIRGGPCHLSSFKQCSELCFPLRTVCSFSYGKRLNYYLMNTVNLRIWGDKKIWSLFHWLMNNNNKKKNPNVTKKKNVREPSPTLSSSHLHWREPQVNI